MSCWYKVIETPCFPCCWKVEYFTTWFGACGRNDTSLYFKDKRKAEERANQLNKQLETKGD